MFVSPSAHHSIYLQQGQGYLSGLPPAESIQHDMSVRLRRKVKRKRERTLTGSNDVDSSEESDLESPLTSSSLEDLKQRSRSTSSEHQTTLDALHNENSNSSQSSRASNESTHMKSNRRRRKILVTEEKMADALRELHLDLKMFDAASLHSLLQQHQEPTMTDSEMTSTAPKSSDISFVDLEDDDGEEEGDAEAESTLVLSDELKDTLKLFDEQRAKEITKFLASTVQLSKRSENLCSADKMQLVPYTKSPVITVLAESSPNGMDAELIPDTFKSNRSILTTQNLNTLNPDKARASLLFNSSASEMPPLNAPACPYRVEEPIEKYLEKQSLKR